MEPEVRQKPVRYYEIDLLRFVAAVAVVLFHFTFRGYYADRLSPVAYPALAPVTRYGYLGVELFFLISGYVVLLSAQGKTLGQFFASRVSRLYPAFWAACLLTFGVVRLAGPPALGPDWLPYQAATAGGLACNLTMLQSFFGVADLDGQYWTLTLEIIFYFLIAIIIAFGWMRHLLAVLTTWLVFCALPLPPHGSAFATLLFPRYAPLFIAGMVLYLLQTAQVARWKLYALLLAAYALSLRGAFAVAREYGQVYGQPFSRVVVAAVLTACFALLLLVVLRKFRLGESVWLAWAGALTYPLYLVHHNLGYVVLQRAGGHLNKYALLGLLLLLVGGLAYAIHRFVERPGGPWLARHTRQWLARQ